jgi:two-component system, chemotaxis family, protein-glutamate methylesterase/glutaminase
MGHKIRTLLIEDSGFMRIVLTDLLRKDEAIEVVGTAANGLEGVKKSRLLLPDVIVTDMIMPEYDGLYVVREVMRERPTPIILLSALNRADEKIFVALGEGAFDFVDKPSREEMASGGSVLAKTIREASAAKCFRSDAAAPVREDSTQPRPSSSHYGIVALGASTGGPGAVEWIVKNLPGKMPVPVVIAQHMPARFIETFAERLRNYTSLAVTVAVEGESLQAGHIYLACGTANTRVTKSDDIPCISFVEDTYPEFNHPSIDCLFESIALHYGRHSIGVILTGMGKDGARGLRRIRDRGGLTVAQDENSSVVYGMPKAAVENDAILHQIPLAKIPDFIINSL